MGMVGRFALSNGRKRSQEIDSASMEGDVEEERRQEQRAEMKVGPVALSCYCNGS